MQNLNLRADLRWVTKRIRKLARKFRKLQKAVTFTHKQMTCDQLVSTCVGWLNGEKVTLTRVRILTRTKSAQDEANPREWVARRNTS